jgi:serine-type D-Ala-D-Ala carboxypeptidase
LLTLLFTALSLVTGDGLPVKAPRAVGMSAERLRKIDHVVGRGISAGGYPGAAVVVGRKGAAVWEKGFGRLSWSKDDALVVPEQTIYDLASLTKVVGTTTALMILFDEGKIQLDDPLSKFVPEFSGGARDLITIRMLLEHRSGLPAGRELWRIARTPEEARQALMQTELACAPGTCYIYSDIGADMMAFVAEAASGRRLDEFLNERVFGPLGMNDTFFRPADSLRARIAPTEISPPRGYPVRGEVHDENAFALGGVAGHAGLFSTATDLSVFAQMMLNGGEYNGTRIVADTTVALFTRRSSGSRALGWDTCNSDGGCGQYLSDRAYGHTGYTGTSLWIDPDREMFVVLLTNRVHAARARRPAKVISDVRADLADAATLAVMDFGDVMAMPAAFRSDRAIGWNGRERAARSRSARSSKSRSAAARKSSRSKASASKSKKPTSKSSAVRSKTAKKKVVAKSSAKSAGKKVAAKSSAKPSTKKVAAKTPAKSTKKSVAASKKPTTTKKLVAKRATSSSTGPGGV